MNILIVSATKQEVPLLENTNYQVKELTGDCFVFNSKKHGITVLVTGVGMLNTAIGMSRLLSKSSYDFILNVGVAGSFNKKYLLGEVLHVVSDEVYRFGADSPEGFIPIEKMGLNTSGRFKQTKSVFRTLIDLPECSAITVNTVHGESKGIEEAQAFGKDLESMEGAAFMQVCETFGVEGIQIRAVSNYVEPRNKEAWQLKKAITNLNAYLVQLIHKLDEQ